MKLDRFAEAWDEWNEANDEEPYGLEDDILEGYVCDCGDQLGQSADSEEEDGCESGPHDPITRLGDVECGSCDKSFKYEKTCMSCR
jgi:hypothetical protein